MALKMFVKTAVAPVVTPAPQIVKVDTVPVVSEIETLTSEYIKLYRLALERDLKNIASRMEALRKVLVAHANDTMDAKKPVMLSCADGMVLFSERAVETKVPSPMALIKHLEEKFGSEVAYSVAKIGITELRKVLSPMEMQPFVSEEDGARTLKDVVANEA